MTAPTTAQLVSYGAIALLLAFVVWRNAGRRRITPNRLLIAPVLVTVFIGMGLWFNPHPALTIPTLAMLGLAAAMGGAFGWWRAAATRLERDAEGAVWMKAHPAALIAILLVFAMRQAGRHYMGADGDPAHMTNSALIAFDAFLLFALTMVIANRLTLWRRLRMLSRPA